ncbi:hypothetical protein NDU88_003829 [Pleurodeles waltl]|uniref:Uncharacterized protein n=1 Tax=Pleurodeles waltl TaxID=8319 RepID=A0AAV7TRQ6_PLEWA|nr:hypothetical protein NDU88_003829 [Pleurodeles waltl]
MMSAKKGPLLTGEDVLLRLPGVPEKRNGDKAFRSPFVHRVSSQSSFSGLSGNRISGFPLRLRASPLPRYLCEALSPRSERNLIANSEASGAG